MTKQEWLDQVIEKADRLRLLLRAYHPLSYQQPQKLPISAQRAEVACENIRQDIVRKAGNRLDPVVEFNNALGSADIYKIESLLNEAWFGVPESRDCWSVPGFTEAVGLLEDPPEEE